MHWLFMIVMGGIIGWLASIAMKTNAQMGIFANIAVGVVGSLLGFWVAGLIGLGDSFLRWVLAIVGAAVLIFILKAVGIFK